MRKKPSFGPLSSSCLRALLLSLVLTASPLATQQARAEGFGLNEWSARGIALGGAAVARTPDASAVAYNPALITKLKGTHIQAGMSFISPSGTIRYTDNDGVRGAQSPRDDTWPVPNFYLSTQLNDNWYLGVGQFSRFGLGFSYPHNWKGRFNIYSVGLETASINPVIAWKATEKLSLAAGFEAQYLRLDLNKRVQRQLHPPADPLTGEVEVDSDISKATSVGFGFNVAAHYQISDQWAVGAQYRSAMKQRAEGKNEFSMIENKSAHGDDVVMNGLFKDSDVHGTVIMPESFSFGLAWEPNEQWSFEAGAIWTRWSSFRTLRIHFSEPQKSSVPGVSHVSESKKHWSDAWRINFGAEYKPVDWLALRAGILWDQSPMTDHYADYLVPSNDRFTYSVGVGFFLDAWSLDLGYAYIDIQDRYWQKSDELGTLHSRTKNADTHIVSASVGYHF